MTLSYLIVLLKQQLTNTPKYDSYDDLSVLMRNDELAWSVNIVNI